MKLICPHRVERVSIVAYLALGWVILVGMRPMLGSVDGGRPDGTGAGSYVRRPEPVCPRSKTALV